MMDPVAGSGGTAKARAGGGWVGLNHALGNAAGGVRIAGVSERELLDMVDRGLYFRLQRAAPTLGRA
jgi:hypothetical protein